MMKAYGTGSLDVSGLHRRHQRVCANKVTWVLSGLVGLVGT